MRPPGRTAYTGHLHRCVEHGKQHGFVLWVFWGGSDGHFIGRGGLSFLLRVADALHQPQVNVGVDLACHNDVPSSVNLYIAPVGIGHLSKTHENVFVGALRFKGENLVLSRKVASFVEVYGRRIPVSDIPKVTVTFGNLTVNGKPAKVTTAEAIYPGKVPDYADAVAKDGTVVVKVGEPVTNRIERKVRLIGK